MPASVIVNNLTVVHQESGGTVTFSPDVCKTPCGNSVVPIPYVNVAMSRDTGKGSASVTCDGHPVMIEGSCFTKSTGDERGSLGGVVSNVTRGKAEFINFSFDVMLDGKCTARMGDTMLGNKGAAFNTPPAPEIQPNVAVAASSNGANEPDNEDPAFIGVQLLDAHGEPVPDARVLLKTPDGDKLDRQTDREGKVRIDDLVHGVCDVRFPDESRSLTKVKPTAR